VCIRRIEADLMRLLSGTCVWSRVRKGHRGTGTTRSGWDRVDRAGVKCERIRAGSVFINFARQRFAGHLAGVDDVRRGEGESASEVRGS